MNVNMLGLLCALALSTAPADVPVQAYTRVLVPIYLRTPVPGANGSLWTTRFSIRNNGSTGAAILWCTGVCPAIYVPDGELQPGETQHTVPSQVFVGPGVSPGPVLYLVPLDASQISFNLRVADTSRSAVNAGTQIPVVREKDFRTKTTQLLNIPIDARYRNTLRLYSLDPGAADYTLRLYDENSATLLGQTTVHVVAPVIPNLQLEPGYVQLNDVMTLATAATVLLPATVRVEIEPLTPNSVFWAFVSITNNETQQLTVVTPQ